MPTLPKQEWYKPSDIVKECLILNLKGKPSYRYVISLIKKGKLAAKVWAEQPMSKGSDDTRKYYAVHIDEIERFNRNRL